MGGGQQRHARGREAHAAARAGKQQQAQALLQSGDGLGERRLGHVQAQRGAAKVQLFGQGDELAPQAQLDVWVIHMCRISNDADKYIGNAFVYGAYCPLNFLQPQP